MLPWPCLRTSPVAFAMQCTQCLAFLLWNKYYIIEWIWLAKMHHTKLTSQHLFSRLLPIKFCYLLLQWTYCEWEASSLTYLYCSRSRNASLTTHVGSRSHLHTSIPNICAKVECRIGEHYLHWPPCARAGGCSSPSCAAPTWASGPRWRRRGRPSTPARRRSSPACSTGQPAASWVNRISYLFVVFVLSILDGHRVEVGLP